MDIKNELPQAFLERVQEIVPNEQLHQVLLSYTVRKPTTFRVNTLKSSTDEVVSVLERDGIRIRAVAWYSDAFILEDQDSRLLTEHQLYAEGKIYVQSISSMIPALVLKPHSTDQVLDLCAAPGSKTTQMAAMMANGGSIVANDLSTVRLYKLAHNLKLQGVTNTKTMRGRGEEVWKRYKGRFDKVLADVPCSLEGRFSLLDPKTFDGWSEKKVKDLAQRMKYLLWSAVNAAKPGGMVVYSTCTMSPEENEGVVDWVLKKEGARLKVATISLEGPAFSAGLTAWRGSNYQSDCAKTRRIFPSSTMEGFYIAALEVL